MIQANSKRLKIPSRGDATSSRKAMFFAMGGCIFVLGMIYIWWFTPAVLRPDELIMIASVSVKPNVSPRCRQWNTTKLICLPNVMLIGASKCGTTSAFAHLKFHPSVESVRRRVIPQDRFNEIHRFDNPMYPLTPQNLNVAIEWASSPYLDSENIALIHYTPHYIYAPSVPYDVRSFYPHASDMKFIVLLRDPVQRALSSYWFKNSEKFQGADKGSIDNFRRVLADEKNSRIAYEKCMGESEFKYVDDEGPLSEYDAARNFNILSTCFGNKFRASELGLRHIDKGIYVDQFERWFQNFRRDQFIIIKYEDWVKSPVEYYEKLLNFIGQKMIGDGGFASEKDLEFLTKNYLSTSNTHKTSLPDDVMHELACFYKPYNTKLNALLKYEVYSTNVEDCV